MSKFATVLRVGGWAVLLAFLLFLGCNGGGGGVPAIGPSIEPGTAPPATVGVPYNLSFRWTTNVAKPPFFWHLFGSMPRGLQFDPANGRIFGTPTSPGSVPFTVVVRDSNSPQREEQRGYTLLVNPPPTTPLIILPPPPILPKAKVGIPYYQEIHATGGLPPYTCSVNGYLPPGINLNASNCTLSGTGTLTGAYSFTLFIFDSQAPPAQVSAAYTLNVIDPLQVLTSSMPIGKVGEDYEPFGPNSPFQLLAKGGVPCAAGPPYIWAFESGYRPPGLSFNPTGTVTGAPATAGFFDFLVRVTDCDNPVETTTRNVSINIVGSLNVTTQVLPECKKDIAYSAEINVIGGVPPYSWSLDGQLPVGLSFDSAAGHITGIPSTTGAFPILVTITDSNPTPPNVAQFTGTLTCIDPVQITTGTLPDGVTGVAYNTQLQAKGGVPSCPNLPPPTNDDYDWALVNGFLPVALTINLNGTITGVPNQPGTFDFLVSAADCNPSPPGEVTTRNLSITIAAPLSITSPTVLPPATVGVPYFFQLTATGGITPYTWSADSGTLPPGLSLSSSGLISGTPTTGGTFKLNVRVTDSATPAQSVAQDPTLVVSQFIVVTATVQDGEQGVTYSTNQATNPMEFEVLGGTPNYCWYLASGTLPPTIAANTLTFGVPQAGNVFTMTSGVFLLTPADVGTWNFRLEFRDDGDGDGTPCEANGQDRNFTRDYSLAVVRPPAVATTVLSDAYVNIPYSEALRVSGGIGPYTWTQTAGSLPPEISLNTDGTLSGTPTIANTTGYNFTARVTDSNGLFATQALTLRVLQDIVLCVDGLNGDDATGDGTTGRPFKTLNKALAYTSANNTDPSGTLTRIGAIRVAGSTFGPPLTYNENITLNASPLVQTDVDLLGGWTGFPGNFCASRGSTPNSRIKGLSGTFRPTIATFNLTRSTWIEMFYIDGDAATQFDSVGIGNSTTSLGGTTPSSPTIARNIITGGNASDPLQGRSMGIADENGSTPLIIENEITGGQALSFTFGIIEFSSFAEIRDNRVDGGDPTATIGSTSAAIKSANGSNPLIYDNTRVGLVILGTGITGGTGASAFGVWVDPADANIARNIINCEGLAGTTTVCAGIAVLDASTATINANSINDLATSGINALGTSTRGVWLDNGSTATLLGNNLVYGGEGTSTSYGVIAENAGTVVTIGDPLNAPGGRNTINGGGCVSGSTFDSYGVKTYTTATANVWFNTINGGCGTNSSTGVGADPSIGNLNGNTINGNLPAVQLPPWQSLFSYGVRYDNSTGFITNNDINGGNGVVCIAKQLIGPNFPAPETGNTYTCGGTNSYGLWMENCPQGAGIVLENHDGQPIPGHDGIIYGGDPVGPPPPTTSTGLKLKNCNAEVRFNVIDGGSGMTATGIDVDPSNPNIHNNTIRGSQAAGTTLSAIGVAYYGSSAGTLGGAAGDDNDIVGAEGASLPAFSTGVQVNDTSDPTISENNNTADAISGGVATTSSYGIQWNSSAGADPGSEVFGNNINGGSCAGCWSHGMSIFDGAPTIGGPLASDNNIINAGSAATTYGILVFGTANPTITGNPLSISGGTATSFSHGILGDSASWTGTVSSNTITGGTCTGCSSYGIFLWQGTPTIGPSNSIDGGTDGNTFGIYLTGTANPTITGNTPSITGGTATIQSIGIYGNTASWTGTVSSNTISGGTCTGCFSYGIRINAGSPTIGPSNGINGGAAGRTWGIVSEGTANPTISGNVPAGINGGTATVFSFGVYGNTASWTGTVTGNTITGGICAGCISNGIYIAGGMPTIGGPLATDNNVIDGGTGAVTRGIIVVGTATPTITGNNASITGGTASAGVTIGIFWISSGGGTITNNKVFGGTSCALLGCSSEGIRVSSGTPLITANGLIKGGTAFQAFGILVNGTGNPGITLNASIDGGTSNGVAAFSGARGVAGNTASWVGAVTSNTISGGGCSAACSSGSGGFELSNGAPVVTLNTITAGTYLPQRYGSLFFLGTTIATFTGNSSTGASGTGYDIFDLRPPASGFINATGTVMTSPFNPLYGPPGTVAFCSDWVLNGLIPTELLGDNLPAYDSNLAADALPPGLTTSPGGAFAPVPGPVPAFFSGVTGPYLFIAGPGNCIQF